MYKVSNSNHYKQRFDFFNQFSQRLYFYFQFADSTSLFDISVGINVTNLTLSTFSASKPNWTRVFNKTLKLPEDAIQLQYDENTSRILADVRSLDTTKKEEILQL